MRSSAFLAHRPPPGWIWTAGVLLCGAVLACGSTDPGTPTPSSHSTGGSPGGTGGTRSGGENAGGRSVIGASGTGTIAGSGAGAHTTGTSGGTAGRPNGVAGTGLGSATAGQGPSTPPAPNPDGSSPYERECHGDSLDCGDVPTLLCLGIRDETTVDGYSCSNPCESDSDCTSAPSSAEAKAGCVDFVTQKHCLLVCLDGTKRSTCPTGMGCYVYPQTTVGYCLWQ